MSNRTATAVDFFKAMASGDIVFNLCDVSKAKGFMLEKTNLQSKNSASPSETAFSSIALTALGKMNLPIALKIFEDKDNDKNILGLKYEMKIYKRIIENIILRNQSPNFVGYIASACCKKDTGLYADVAEELYAKDYCILVTEKVGNGKYFGFDGYFPVEFLMNLYPDLETEDKKAVLFQICYSLELIQRYGIVHNDFHANNVLVMILPRPVTMGFNIGDRKFQITTKYIPYLFDWDAAYCEVFGPNPKLETEQWYKINVHNKFNKKIDLFVLLCTLEEELPDMMKGIENNLKIRIKREAAAEIIKFRPLFTTERGIPVYRIGKNKLAELLGPEYAGMSYATVYLSVVGINIYLHFFRGFRCRPFSLDRRMDTPLSYIDRKLRNFEVKELDDIKFVYTMPSEEKLKSIFIDPLIAKRGRETLEELGIKPRFPPQKSGYVKTRDFKDVVVDYNIPLENIKERLKHVKDNYEY